MLGHRRATADVLFFKFFKKGQEGSSRWLFFHRTRASIDYQMTDSTFLPQFGMTQAVSYNHPRLHGFAPVAVGQVLSRGVFVKGGVQYAYGGKALTIFTWLVYEVYNHAALDYFLLLRYTPRLSDTMRLFLQAESVNNFPIEADLPFGFTQRLRAGVQVNHYQVGTAVDLSQVGRTTPAQTANVGLFIRHEF